MTKKQKFYKRQIDRLMGVKRRLSKELDKSYARGNMSDYIVLENEYKSIVGRISSLLARLGPRS